MSGMRDSFGVSNRTRTLITEGMGGRMKRNGGNLVPLKERISKYRMAKRNIRIAARRTVAEQLIARHNMIAIAMQNLLGRSFFGRLKWVATGR